jgi:hypothetical protein
MPGKVSILHSCDVYTPGSLAKLSVDVISAYKIILTRPRFAAIIYHNASKGLLGEL